MKKILTVALALLMVTGLTACGNAGNNNSSSQGSSTSANSTVDNSQSGESSESSQSGDSSEGSQSGDTAPEAAKLTAKLELISLDDRDPSVLRGVSIAGNQVGSTEFNNRKPALEDVRCIFALSEWVEFYPDTDAKSGLRVWVLKHRDDQEYYNTCTFSDLMPGFANYCDLHYPEDAEDPATACWGSFYLHHEEQEPGYYDFVFTCEGKAIGVLLTRFYNHDDISDKSDEALEALMHE